jgi:anti-sigma regulatory factor (Ser/Thr protein kinase)
MGSTRLRATDHVVQFYAEDPELVRSVGPYLAEATEADGVAMVIATPDHCRAIAAGLGILGIDVDRARADGQLILLDAARALGRFLSGGTPNKDRFDQSVGRHIRKAAHGGRQVHAYGEMVALLWDAGQLTAAMELEELWNELGHDVPFSLYCAYRVEEAGIHPPEMEAVCRLHSSVVGDRPQTRLKTSPVLPVNSWAGREARAFVTGTLHEWSLGHLADDACIVVSELANNAVAHAAGPSSVTLQQHNGRLRLSVCDESPEIPIPRRASRLETSGRGLAIVEAFSAAWGAARNGRGGKTVWAELATLASRLDRI